MPNPIAICLASIVVSKKLGARPARMSDPVTSDHAPNIRKS
jgi:hypothetical protein